MDVWGPKVLGEETEYASIAAFLRINQDSSSAVLANSGLESVYVKPLDQGPSGAIKWTKPQEGEKPSVFAARVRTLAEGAAECRGVAFSSAGSLGLRENPHSQARQWRVTGFRYSTSHAQVIKLLQDQKLESGVV